MEICFDLTFFVTDLKYDVNINNFPVPLYVRLTWIFSEI